MLPSSMTHRQKTKRAEPLASCCVVALSRHRYAIEVVSQFFTSKSLTAEREKLCNIGKYPNLLTNRIHIFP